MVFTPPTLVCVKMRAVQRDKFPAVTASKVRLLVVETKGGETPSIFKFAIYLLKL